MATIELIQEGVQNNSTLSVSMGDVFTPPFPGSVVMNQEELPGYLLTNTRLVGLARKSLQPFRQNTALGNNRAAQDTRLKVFVDGGEPFSPLHTTEGTTQFEQAATRLIATYCKDYFQTDGSFTTFAAEQKWRTISEVVPELISRFVDRASADRESYISLVDQHHALNLLAMALHMVEHPKSRLTIKTALGGSDSPTTSPRLPAYIVPALFIADSINEYFSQRAHNVTVQNNVLIAAAMNKLLTSFHGTPDDLKSARANAGTALRSGQIKIEDVLSSAEQHQALVEACAADRQPVQVSIVFAENSAKAVNTTMSTGGIAERTVANIAALEQFIGHNFRHMKSSVEVTRDKAWTEHSLYTQTLLHYFVDLLQSGRLQNATLNGVLEELENRGEKHGGALGRKQAVEYAAMHTLLFGDQLYVPQRYQFVSSRFPQEDLQISIGARTEREFDFVRQYVMTHATREGLVNAIQEEAEVSTRNRRELLSLADCVQRTPLNPKPIHQVMLIGTTGEQLPYYPLELETKEVRGISQSVSLEELIVRIQALPTRTVYERVYRDGLLRDCLAIQLVEKGRR